MSLPPKYTFSLYAGDDAPITIRYKDDNGTAVDLTGYTASMDLKLALCDSPSLSIIGTIAAPTTGEIVFAISGDQKSALVINCESTCYLYDIELTGGDVSTILRGTVRIEMDVTE